MNHLFCALCERYTTHDPWQTSCGHHLCGTCYEECKRGNDGTKEITCLHCKADFTWATSFRDKAFERELKRTTEPCTHPGCLWKGEGKVVMDHMTRCSYSRTTPPNNSVVDISLQRNHSNSLIQSTNVQLHTTQNTLSLMSQEMEKLKLEFSSRIQPLADSLSKLCSSVQSLQQNFEEMSLLTETLQATSYNGVYIWKIPDIRRRRQDARTGMIVSLYSVPFYTSRHGYKMCLRVYLNGDGSGKETHLSFYLTLMKGEYDALLQWPFSQQVTLMLLDQDKRKHMVQSFRPEPSSSSFQRPKDDMNVASGCPRFAPLNVLDTSSYVRDDTMFLKCVIDTTGLDVSN